MIFFWHIPKTGGSTLRERYKHKVHSNVRRWVSMGIDASGYEKLKIKAENTFLASNDPGYEEKILFWELHGGMPLVQLNDDIRHWRQLARQNNKTFFSFTLFRDGPAAAILYFNFYCPPCNDTRLWKRYDIEENSKDTFLQSYPTWMDYQTRILFGTGPYYGEQVFNRSITLEQCHNLYRDSALDWIGTTEKLSTQTIPMLEYLVTHKASVKGGKLQNEKVASERYKEGNVSHVHLSDLSPDEYRFVRERTSRDQAVWERARRDYQWESSTPEVIMRPC